MTVVDLLPYLTPTPWVNRQLVWPRLPGSTDGWFHSSHHTSMPDHLSSLGGGGGSNEACIGAHLVAPAWCSRKTR